MPPLAQKALLDKTYDETLALLVETRNYLAYKEPLDRLPNATARLNLSCEAFRITARLTQVMAWVLIRRAVQYGEVTEAEAGDERYRLSGTEVCLDNAGCGDDGLPAALRSLLLRSFRLYVRIGRLDAMLRGIQLVDWPVNAGAEDPPPESGAVVPMSRSSHTTS